MKDFSNWTQVQLDNWSDLHNLNNEAYIGNDEDDGFSSNDIFINDMD